MKNAMFTYNDVDYIYFMIFYDDSLPFVLIFRSQTPQVGNIINFIRATWTFYQPRKVGRERGSVL